MGIKRTTSEKAVLGALLATAEAQRKLVLTDLGYIGESAVRHARKNHSYKDWSGNLTSSIGYVIYEDDKPIQMSDFEQVKPNENFDNSVELNGSEVGKQFAAKISQIAKQKHKLVIVAGMVYAEAVQKYKYEVLQGAIILAKNLLKRWYPDTKFEER